MIRWVTFILATTLLLACDKPAEPAEPEAEGAAVAEKLPGEVGDQVEKGVKDVLDAKGPKWRVEYDGDISGAVEGGILSVITMQGNRTLAGAAMTEDMKGKAPQSFRVSIHDIPKEGFKPLMASLKLPDGTKCTDTTGKDTKAEIMNGEKKKLEAKLTGTMRCGDDKKITYTAFIDETP